MKMYDLFNGDADGICALHQLRLQKPAESVLSRCFIIILLLQIS